MNATQKQTDYVAVLKQRLHLSTDWFTGYCVATYGGEPEQLDIPTCSALIGEMVDWTERPDKLLRAQGQIDMFGGAL